MSGKMKWMEHPAVEKMDPGKLAIIEEFVKQMEGRTAMSAMPLLLQTQKKMQETGLEFTQEESSLLIEILTADMTPAERAKVDQMRQMVEKYKQQK